MSAHHLLPTTTLALLGITGLVALSLTITLL
jgi:hypothetical protein